MQDNTALDPENRALYAEILRAPAGYDLDAAVATTYTLDFETALVVPATLAFHAAENRQETLDTPLALLEGLERLSARIAIFCEAGRIKAVPKGANRLTALLEDTVTEVTAPRGGAFHPKLWLLRFTPMGGRGRPHLRLALLSRNLTTDASWDLSLSLDGEASSTAKAQNAPLVALVRALPGLSSGRPAPDHVTAMVTSLADDLERAEWDHPEHIRKISFAVNGLTDDVWRPRIGGTVGIISPFVTDGALIALCGGVDPSRACLLSRGEELACLKPETLAQFGKVHVLDEMAETEDGEETEDTKDTGMASVPARGLHAKAFMTERYSSTEITMGSGNATTPALLGGQNVEVFATLSGYTRDLGSVEDQMSPDRLGRFLREFVPFDPPASEPEIAAEKRLDELRRTLAAGDPVLRCEEEDEGRIRLHLSARTAVRIPEGMSVRLWPIVTGIENGIVVDAIDGSERLLARLALKDVTRWIGIRLTDEDSHMEQDFTLGTELVDLPEARTAEILRALIENRDAFLRYVRLLLGDVSEAAKTLFAAGQGGTLAGVFGTGHDSPILEDMVRALAGDGRQLRDIERLVTRLSDPETGRSEVIPDEFLDLWQTFKSVMPEETR
ncbi:phospholipase D family protein [Chachezhania antarctica]|uniref:phospholipase D family protein n=1 Tax=Chachezhania antarctica TaxID=2340860 RepID=UPI000EB28949|nr:phospholipase D family protein [Chachezhania antarctica]|tara:strand:+ start:585 stop:2432 length:1848 start_codon:yes stop_codon:yes gene_type:complete